MNGAPLTTRSRTESSVSRSGTFTFMAPIIACRALHLRCHRTRKRGGAARLGRLLEGKTVTQECRFRPCGADERKRCRQAGDKAHRDREMRVTRDGGRRREVAGAGIAVDRIEQPRQSTAGCHERIDTMLLERRVQALGTCKAAAVRERLEVRRIREIALGL